MVVVWICIPGLLVEQCNDTFLKRIGNVLGHMLKIDSLTSVHDRGKYARICVELDLDRPLSSHIDIMGN